MDNYDYVPANNVPKIAIGVARLTYDPNLTESSPFTHKLFYVYTNDPGKVFRGDTVPGCNTDGFDSATTTGVRGASLVQSGTVLDSATTIGVSGAPLVQSGIVFDPVALDGYGFGSAGSEITLSLTPISAREAAVSVRIISGHDPHHVSIGNHILTIPTTDFCQCTWFMASCKKLCLTAESSNLI